MKVRHTDRRREISFDEDAARLRENVASNSLLLPYRLQLASEQHSWYLSLLPCAPFNVYGFFKNVARWWKVSAFQTKTFTMR